MGGSRPRRRRQRPPTRAIEVCHASWCPHRWRRLPRPERGHPRDRAQGRTEHGFDFVGFRDGWRGPLEGVTSSRSTSRTVRGILPRGGTILGTSRTNPYHDRRRRRRRSATTSSDLASTRSSRSAARAPRCRDRGSTTSRAPGHRRAEDDRQRPRPRPTTRSASTPPCTSRARRSTGCTRPPSRHHRVARRRGHGPQRRLDRAARGAGRRRERHPDPRGAARRRRRSRSAGSTSRFETHYSPIIVVAEGAQPADGDLLTRTRRSTRSARPARRHRRAGSPREIEARTGNEARTTALGHVQRGGTPTAYDRVLATRFGLNAVDAVAEGDWGKMVALRGTDIVRVPLADAREAQDRPARLLRRGRGLLRVSAPVSAVDGHLRDALS